MKTKPWHAWLVMAALISLSGCAVNRATATVEPNANLAAIKRVHVVKHANDSRDVNKLIAERLGEMGMTATTSADKQTDVDAIVTYIDKWMWDITMYLLELTIIVRDPVTEFPKATGNSLHTSLTRLPPKEMVKEVTGNIWKDVKK